MAQIRFQKKSLNPLQGFFHTFGLVGSLISMLAYVGAVIATFRLASLIWGEKFPPWLATLVFALNPNLLYVQATPVTEPLFLCTSLWAVYCFVQWIGGSQSRYLLLAAFWTFLATLIRYEAWFLLVGIVGVISWMGYRQKWTGAQWEGTTLAFLSLAGLGVVSWLLCHLAISGNPLNFLTGKYGILASQTRLEAEGMLPTKGNFLLSFVSVIYTAAANSGIVLYVLFVIGLGIGLSECIGDRKEKKNTGHTLRLPFCGLLFFVPVLAHLIAVTTGLSTVVVPELSGLLGPEIFKARYGLLMLPVVALFIGALGRFRHRFLRVALVLIIVGQYGWLVATGGIVTLNDATVGWSAAPPRKAEQWLAKNYEEGLILVDAFEIVPRFRDTQIPLSRFITQSAGAYWQESLQDANRHASWIWMRPNDEVWTAIWRTPVFTANFRQVFKDDQMLIYRRK